MVSHVYFALHSRLPALKVGKGNIVENRLREIGIDYFNIANSFALQVSDEGAANNLERIFHRTFRHKRWVDPTDLPSDGISEWFSIECLDLIDLLFEGLHSHIKFKKIPISRSEKPLLQERPSKPKKMQPNKVGFHPSELDGLIYSLTYLTEWLDQVKNEYPGISINYVEGGAIVIRDYPESFIPLVAPFWLKSYFDWREERSNDEIWQGSGSVIRLVTKTQRSKRGEGEGPEDKKWLPMERIRFDIAFNHFPSGDLHETITRFIGRWPTSSLPIASPARYARSP